MFKATQQTVGHTASLITPADATILYVDQAYAAYLASVLGTGDWTYIMAAVGTSVEVMKVTGTVTGNGLVVERHRDSTLGLVLGPNTPLQFMLGYEAVLDMIAVVAPATVRSIAAEYPLSIEDTTGDGDYVISAHFDVSSSDGSITVASDEGQFDI